MLSQKTSGGLSQNDSSNSRKAPGYLNWTADVGIDDIPLRYRMDCLCWKCHQIPKERTREIKLSFPFFLRLQHGRWGAGLHSKTSLPWPWKIQSQSGSEFSLYLVIAWDLGMKKRIYSGENCSAPSGAAFLSQVQSLNIWRGCISHSIKRFFHRKKHQTHKTTAKLNRTKLGIERHNSDQNHGLLIIRQNKSKIDNHQQKKIT